MLFCSLLSSPYLQDSSTSFIHGTRPLPPSSSWIWRQFHLSFGILTFGYCLLEIRLICAVNTPKLIQQKPFFPEVVCGICGKVDNTVSLLGSASLCFSGVFQGCHVSRVLFEFHSCLWLPWEDSKCPEFSKGAFPEFWRTNKPVCYPVICWLRWPCLPFLHRLESAVAKLCAAPTLRSPVYCRRLLLCSAFCGHHPRAHSEREKSHGKTLIGPHKSVLPVLFYSNFLSQKQITQSPICPTGKFMFFRNVLVTSEKQHCPPWCVFGGSDILDVFLKFLMGGQGEMWFYGL